MFFFLSKILGFLISPLTWILILLIIAFFSRKPAKSRRFITITLILCLFLSNNFIADECMRLWEMPTTKTEMMPGTYDLGIVLSGGMVQEDKPSGRMIFRINTDRFLQALDLYKKGKIRKMLLSGGAGQLLYRDMLESALLKTYLVGIGIPAGDILVDSLSDNTRQNAVNSASIIAANCPNGRYLLITSASHMRRAQACFKKAGINCTPYTTNKLTGKRVWSIQHLLVPDLRSIQFYDTLIHETTGYFVYWLMGYV